MKSKLISFNELLIDSTRNGISKPKAVRGEGVPMVNMGELFHYNRIPDLSGLELVPLNESESKRFLLKENDLLFARRSLTLEGAGKCSIFLGQKNTTFESSIIRARIDEMKANPKFYYYYFQSKLGKALISSIVEQVAVAGIRGSDLKKLKVHYLERETQDKITNALDTIDQKIELNNQIISKLEELAQNLFKRWFIDFEFPNDDGDPYRSSGGTMVESELGLIPKGWEVKTLDEIAHYQNGLAMQKYPPESESDSLPVIKIKELNKGSTDGNSNRCSKNIKESVKVNDGDVLFSWSGSLLVKLWMGGRAGLNQHLFKVTSDIYPKWLYYYWTLHHLRQFTSIAQDKATTMGHIKRSHLKEAKVVIPSFNKEVEYFNDHISPLLEKIIEAGVENKKLVALRDTMIPKLLSGEIELNETTEEGDNVLVQ